MDTSLLLWGLLFGSMGVGFFMYGKKQRSPVPLLVGVALFVLPYLVHNTVGLVLAGIVLVAIAYFLRRR